MAFAPLSEGSTLLIPSGPRRHLFVVLTKPTAQDEQVLIVGISSIRYGEYHDAACKLYAGDHPFLTRPSFVRYEFARTVSMKRIRESIANGTVEVREPVAGDILERIAHGLVMSRHTRPRISTFYVNRPD